MVGEWGVAYRKITTRVKLSSRKQKLKQTFAVFQCVHFIGGQGGVSVSPSNLPWCVKKSTPNNTPLKQQYVQKDFSSGCTSF